MLKIVVMVVCVALQVLLVEALMQEHRNRLREVKRSLNLDKVTPQAPNLYKNLPRFRETHVPKIKAATDQFQQRMRQLKSGELYTSPRELSRQLSVIQIHQIAMTLQALKEKNKREAAERMREQEARFEAERDNWMNKDRHRQPSAPAQPPTAPPGFTTDRAGPTCPAGTTSINGICVKINGL